MSDQDRPIGQLAFPTHPLGWGALSAHQFRLHAATHEAGHVVIGVAQNFTILDVTIDCDPISHPDGGFIFGGTRFEAPDGDMHALARLRPAEMGVTLMAGMCAEEVILGTHLRESWMGDLRILRIGHGWLDGLTERPAEVFAYLNDAHEAVKEAESRIRRVADALAQRGRLTGNHIAELLKPRA